MYGALYISILYSSIQDMIKRHQNGRRGVIGVRWCASCHVSCCSIMNKFGKSFETMTDTYEPTTGVIRREKSKLKVGWTYQGHTDDTSKIL